MHQDVWPLLSGQNKTSPRVEVPLSALPGAAMVAALHGPSAGPPVGLLDAIKAAKQKPPKPAAAAPVVDLFAELRRTATRLE